MKEESSVSNTTEATSSAEESKTNLKDVVSYETHAKLLKQRKTDQEKMRQLEERVSQFELEKKRVEEEELEKQGNYQKMVENLKQELEAANKERDGMRKKVTNAIKMHAFEAALPGKIKKPAYRTFIPLDDIVIDPETGNVETNSLSQVVENFMEEYGKDILSIPNQDKKMPSSPSNIKTTAPSGDVRESLMKGLEKIIQT